MGLYNYLFAKKPNADNEMLEKKSNMGHSQKDKFVSIKTRPEITKKAKIFVILDKNSLNPIGVFDNLEEAIKNGQDKTFHNCMVLPFDVNESCKYLNNPVFESK